MHSITYLLYIFLFQITFNSKTTGSVFSFCILKDNFKIINMFIGLIEMKIIQKGSIRS